MVGGIYKFLGQIFGIERLVEEAGGIPVDVRRHLRFQGDTSAIQVRGQKENWVSKREGKHLDRN